MMLGAYWLGHDIGFREGQRERDRARVFRKVYHVPFVFDHRRNARREFEKLEELITTTVKPESWASANAGGLGSIDYVWRNQSILVTNYGDVHEGVEKLLAQLEKISLAQGRKGAKPRTNPSPSSGGWWLKAAKTPWASQEGGRK
jgi:hypothetical protein